MEDYKQKVLQYYSLVDSNSFEELFKLFSQKIIYLRGEETISGIADFKKFYLNKRGLTGKHLVHEAIANENQIIIKGTFAGINSNNNKITMAFADFFYFDEKGLIDKRQTYLANGSNIIK